MKAFLVPFAVSLALVLAAGNPSMAADQTKTPAPPAPHHAIYMPPPHKHGNYECANGTCTCSNQKDCSYMNSDGVCKEGTYSNQSCVAKEQ